MKKHVTETTKMFTKLNGQIICNKGAQAQEVLELLTANGYTAEDVSTKKAKVIYKYCKVTK